MRDGSDGSGSPRGLRVVTRFPRMCVKSLASGCSSHDSFPRLGEDGGLLLPPRNTSGDAWPHR